MKSLWNRFWCRLGYHDFDHCGEFCFCLRPECTHVRWYTGEWDWDLDVVDTCKYYYWLEVQ